jgi:hypothetical protein
MALERIAGRKSCPSVPQHDPGPLLGVEPSSLAVGAAVAREMVGRSNSKRSIIGGEEDDFH